MHFKAQKYLSHAFIFLLFISFFSTQLFAQKGENEISKIQEELLIIQSPGHLNLNPQLSSYSSEAQILSGLYEGLFSYDPLSLEPIPALASSYKISRDKKTWTLAYVKMRDLLTVIP